MNLIRARSKLRALVVATALDVGRLTEIQRSANALDTDDADFLEDEIDEGHVRFQALAEALAILEAPPDDGHGPAEAETDVPPDDDSDGDTPVHPAMN